MALFLEGVGAIGQACTMPLLLSAGVFLLAAGADLGLAAVAHTAGIALMAWLRFARIVTVDLADGPTVLAGLLVAAAALALALTRSSPARAWIVGAGAATGGALAAAVWRPCVGTELATVVNSAAGDRLGSLGPLALYVSGTALAVLAVGMVPVAAPRVAEWLGRRPVPATGAVLGVALGLAMATGLWSDVIDEMVVL